MVAVLRCAAAPAAGQESPDARLEEAQTAYDEARRLYELGSYKEAEALYERALGIVESTQGRNHPSIADLLNHLAQLRVADDRLDDALPLFRRAFAISELRLRREALDSSESRLSSFMSHLRTQEELLYELVRAEPDDEDVRRLVLTAALLRKGRSVAETADTSRIIYRRVSDRNRGDFERLRDLRSQLASLSLQGPGSLSPLEYRQRLKALAEQGDALEASLAMRSAPLRSLITLPPPEEMVDRVASALPSDSALVEFIAYTDRSILREPGTREPRRSQQLRYLVLVLFKNGRTSALDLGPAAPIDDAAVAMRDAMARRDATFLDSARALHGRVFHPLRELLGNTRNVFLSPDGQLNLVPFAALHDGHQYLVDLYDFTYLTSGKDLLPRARAVGPSQSVVVLADPDFHVPVPNSPDTARGQEERSVFVERFFSTLRADVARGPWTPLPGTRGEAEAIQRMFPRAELLLGAEATKERLLHLSAPGVLHLATHGFFLEDTVAREATRAVGHFGALGVDARSAAPADPLLRSGLILAGASAPASSAPGAAGPLPESTLVTALELAGLNLWGTQLVVLSACDTGRGAVKLGQGVYGLRRAFVAAGAETVVMSLWKVNDETTRVLMERYYRNLLAGQGRATALRQAMLALRQTQPHPHAWAPFIVVGQNSPLRVQERGSRTR
ncbi:CHAT domain-containing tetratricopeptide repeat protein [Hyalangium sp.]|uniref:CHAT domain-containing tetratricopeptide repeat protein n=1 Tax=Hyalangium sp. TaxID=2028555 RepID=UPI002D6608DB|nr:CHAT domain-containing tetratricopeptide repeat protein [Hyalangium sp.]HYH96679.1 CHAT domain-containing tetratricopeptide repeat protein [Hyalangium sp.]